MASVPLPKPVAAFDMRSPAWPNPATGINFEKAYALYPYDNGQPVDG